MSLFINHGNGQFWLVSFEIIKTLGRIHTHVQTSRIKSALDGMEDEAITLEETAELADEKEMEDEIETDTEDKQ